MLNLLKVFTVLFGLAVAALMFSIGMAPMVDGVEKGGDLVAAAKMLLPFVLIAFACSLGAMITVAKK